MQLPVAMNTSGVLCSPCHKNRLRFAQRSGRPVQTPSLCCKGRKAERTPGFWPASPVCKDLVHYSREELQHKTGRISDYQ